MRPVVTVQYHGLRAIEENLRILREQFGVRTGGILIRGLRAGAKLIRNEAKQRVTHVPSGLVSFIDFAKTRKGGRRRKFNSPEGMLRQNIVEHAVAADKPTVYVRVRNRGYQRVGKSIRFNRPGSSPGWWWWLEFGTLRMPARSFLRGAFEAKKFEALQVSIARMRTEIDEWFQKTLKKAA